MHALDLPHVPRPESIDAEWKAAEATYEAARKKFLDACKAHDAANERLVYAAGSRCRCGAGMAYKNTVGIRGAWECSALLKGDAIEDTTQPRQHDDPMDFAFWSVKSENQPSANGHTTRPKD